MTKEELMKLAEAGVREELKAIQARLSYLAKAFPHIVGHQDGSVPAVLPLEAKSQKRSEGQKKRRTAAESQAIVREFLKNNPGANTTQVMEALGGVVRTQANKVLRDAGAKVFGPKPPKGSRVEFRWKM